VGTIQKSHLGAMLFLEEAIQSSEQNGCGNFVRSNEVQGLAHGNKNFFIYSGMP